VQSTVAVSRLVGSMKDHENLNLLKDSLKAIQDFSSSSINSGTKDFGGSVAELIARMFRLIDYSAKIYGSNVRNDPETIAEVYLRISNDYFDSPDLRVQWLLNLAKFQVGQNNLEEAAQCKLHIAALVVEYLVVRAQLQVRNLSKEASFPDIAPNVLHDTSLPQIQDESTFQNGEIWSVKGLNKLLKSAVKLLEKAKVYEVCLEVMMMLTAILSAVKDYTALSNVLERFRSLTDTLITANKEVRVFPVYYRVGYYGSEFKELDGKQFVYRLPGHTKLGHIQNQLKEKHKGRVGGDPENVVILQNKPIEAVEMAKDKIYVQIGAVNPHVDSSRVTPHARNFNLDSFIFETGYSAQGKNVAEGLARQQKKKVMFKTSLRFPYMLNRLPVVSTENVILTPLENAVELIEGRVAALREQLDTNPPRMNALHSVIQGSVVTMVNEGPLKICETFLSPGAIDPDTNKPYDPRLIAALKENMSSFVRLCGFAIRMSQRIISSEHIPFQNMVESKYLTLKETAAKYIEEQ